MARGDCPECGTPGFEFWKRCPECGFSGPVATLSRVEAIIADVDGRRTVSPAQRALIEELRSELERCEHVVQSAVTQARRILAEARNQAAVIHEQAAVNAKSPLVEAQRDMAALTSELRRLHEQAAMDRDAHRSALATQDLQWNARLQSREAELLDKLARAAAENDELRAELISLSANAAAVEHGDDSRASHLPPIAPSQGPVYRPPEIRSWILWVALATVLLALATGALAG